MVKKFQKASGYFHRNFLLPRILNFKNREILAKNKKLKNIYKGKRCFLIGGGPSIKQIDLGRLKNEYTFVVAEFDKNPQFHALNPKFHILSDSTYFTEGESEYWNEQFTRKDQTISPTTTIFVNLDAKTFIEKRNMFSRHNLFYIGTQGIMTENFPFNIELDKYVPWPKNSILLCLVIAAYLGFEKIYLLGCEHNFLSFNIGKGKDIAYSHSYEDEISRTDTTDTKAVQKVAIPRDLTMTYEDNIAHVLQLFRNYRFLYKKIKNIYPDTKILNATPNSFLDVFPSVKFEDIRL